MNDTRYVPVKDEGMKTYMFRAEVAREKDGRFSAWIAALPGCDTGQGREEYKIVHMDGDSRIEYH